MLFNVTANPYTSKGSCEGDFRTSIPKLSVLISYLYWVRRNIEQIRMSRLSTARTGKSSEQYRRTAPHSSFLLRPLTALINVVWAVSDAKGRMALSGVSCSLPTSFARNIGNELCTLSSWFILHSLAVLLAACWSVCRISLLCRRRSVGQCNDYRDSGPGLDLCCGCWAQCLIGSGSSFIQRRPTLLLCSFHFTGRSIVMHLLIVNRRCSGEGFCV